MGDTNVKKKKKKAQLPFRLNILFFIVFLMFSILIVQLGIVQILNGETYQVEIEKTSQDITVIPVPRGKIYDRHHNLLVDNEASYAFTYTPPKGIQAKDKLDLAEKLTAYITLDTEDNLKRITIRNKKEYWYLKNEIEANSRLSEEERKKINNNATAYNTVLERITEEEISNLSKQELEVIAIKRELDKAYSLTPQVIKNKDITTEEYAKVAEHLDVLPGINATTDWSRTYPQDNLFRSFLGKVTSQAEGIPAGKEQYYLTRGYSRNDRVGKSGLEEQYEDVLKGRKEQIQYITNKSHQVIDSKVVVEGERGNDLVLTFDMELQEKIDEVIQEELKTAIEKHPYANRTLNEAFAVVMNPKTGEILAISGREYNRETKEMNNVAIKAISNGYEPGSAIKGATVLAGLESGMIYPGQQFNDKPFQIKGSKVFSSVYPMGIVNDIDALESSSNIYMALIGLRFGGEFDPRPSGNVKFNRKGYQQMVNYFKQFGLGVKTGIDYPSEGIGYPGEVKIPGELINYSIGQFDTYTTLQLAQYVSTIANDGYRVRPHLLKDVRSPNLLEGGLGSVFRSVNPEVLNRIDVDESFIKRVQEGFYRVYHGRRGTATSEFGDKPYIAAGKTGTAEAKATDPVTDKTIDVQHRTLVGYAPFDDPEVAFAVIVPGLGYNVKQQHPINLKIGSGILDAYFDLIEERASQQNTNLDSIDEETEDDNPV